MITLPPFKAFLASNIPSVYDNTLSYYDELTKLIAYLEQQVVPAVNETAGQVDEIKKGLDDLKSYVDHYFDNLDVQEEINNKLDDMAESGQLAGIIAQFLEVAPVFAYDTIAAMAAADNLSNGCIARVLGNTTASAGDGAYYKVRTKEAGESGDGYLKVEIGNTLIADRITDKLQDDFNDYIGDNYINVKFNGAKGDGTADDTEVLQNLIDNNPHKTLFFPAGTYLISEPLEIHTGNANQVNLKLDRNAVITTNTSITYLLIVGAEEAAGSHAYDRYAEGSIVSIDGGVFDCGAAEGAIKLTANQKQTKVSNVIIYNVNDYGIYVDRGTNTSSSSDADITNVSINGLGSEIGGTGIYLYGADNKVSHVRVNKCQIGVEDAAGSSFEDVHCLYSYTTNNVSIAQYEATKGFVFSGTGIVVCNNCYSDTFATGYEIADVPKVYITNSQCYWWTGVAGASVKGIKVPAAGNTFKLDVVNFNMQCPNANFGVNFEGLSVPGGHQYLANYNMINLTNVELGNPGVMSESDWITCQAFYKEDSIVLYDPWSLTMSQNAWYPIAYVRAGVSQFTLRMANDQIVRITLNVGSSSTISITNLYNGAHTGEYEAAICNVSQDANKGNIYAGILCVRSTSATCSFNPCLYDGLRSWNTQIFTRRGFMSATPLTNPTVNASTNFNPN